jgi:ParB family chromosome partitioning protein
VRSRDEDDSLEIALIENIQRQDLTPIEEAQALADLIDQQHYTHDELGTRLGIARASLSNTLRLLQLPDPIKKHIHHKNLTPGHAKALLTLQNETDQLKLAEIAVSKALSVRKTEELARAMASSKESTDSSGVSGSNMSPNLRHLCDQYKGHLGTKVKITGDHERGRIEISYYSHEDLDRITELVIGDLATDQGHH